MSDEELRDAYRRLWNQLRPANPTYWSELMAERLDLERGRYIPRTNGGPEIQLHGAIVREPLEPDIDDLAREPLLAELCTLAHEGGHYISDVRGLAPSNYDSRLRELQSGVGRPTPEDIAAILREEERAWDLGRELLECVGFTEWDALGRDRSDSLESYRQDLERVSEQ